MNAPGKLSRRERQIMDILYRLEKASAREVMANMEDDLSDSSVRTFLRKLEEKGQVGHLESGLKFIYYPLIERKQASVSALTNVVKTFFADSPALAVNSLLDITGSTVTDEELDKLEELIREKKEQRNKTGSRRGGK